MKPLFSLFFAAATFFPIGVFAVGLPQGVAQINPFRGEVLRDFEIDFSGSKNSRGVNQNLQFRFQTDPNSEWTEFSSQQKYTFRPENTGNFVLKFQIKDTENGRTLSGSARYRVGDSTVKKARIRTQTFQVRSGVPIFFEIWLQMPPDINPQKVLTRWDFDSDGNWDTDFQVDKKVSHIFAAAQEVSPTAEVEFPDGEIISVRGIENDSKNEKFDSIRVLPDAIAPPVLQIWASQARDDERKSFTFDASATPTTPHSWLEWQFDGGEFVRGQKLLRRQFQSPGKHRVVLRHCFRRANPVCRQVSDTFEIPESPKIFAAEISMQNKTNSSASHSGAQNYFSARRGDQVRFSVAVKNFSGSRSGLKFRWDFDGNGIWDTGFARQNTAEFAFAKIGRFPVRAQISTAEGMVFSAQKWAVISEPPAPEILIKIPDSTIFVGQKVRFGIQNSGTQNLKSRFDLGADGIWESALDGNHWLEWTFWRAGAFQIRAQVVDQRGVSRDVIQTFSVQNPPQPVARVDVSEFAKDPNQAFEFDASRSSGAGLTYFWQADGQTFTSPSPKFSRGFGESGLYPVSLRVVDLAGRQNSVNFLVRVR